MPVVSALNNCIPPPELSIGNIARVNKIIPIPPNHCVKHLQKRMPWGKLSISVKTVAPVVVKPEIVSKKASATFGMHPCIIKGSIPKIEKKIHVVATIRKPSLFARCFE